MPERPRWRRGRSRSPRTADAGRRVAGRTGAFGLSVAGVIDVGKTGEVTFRAKGAGGCQLWLHEAHVLEYEAGDCTAGRSITLTLAEGRHPYTLYLTTSTGAAGLPVLSVASRTRAYMI